MAIPRGNRVHPFLRTLAPAWLAGLCLMTGSGAVLADGPLLGNPVDAVPRPELPQAPAAQLQAPAAPPPALQQKLAQTITVRHFDVKGSRAIPFERIVSLLEPLSGQTLTLGQLITQVDGITRLYQEQGYALSFALLQEQDFAGGKVVVTIVEGHIDTLDLKGEPGRSAARLQQLARPLIAEKPLTRHTLERTLNLMRTVPGVRITPSLELPRHENGATTLTLDVQHRPLDTTATMADMGTGMQGLVSLSANSLTPLGEKVTVTAAVPTKSRDVRYVAGSLELPLGNQGLALTVDGFHYRSEPRNDAIAQLGWDRRLINERMGASLSYPLILNNHQRLTGRVGMYAARTRDEYLRNSDHAWQAEELDLRVAHAGLDYRYSGQRHTHTSSLAVHRGIDGMGARKRLRTNYGAQGTPDYDLDFTRVVANLKHSIQLPGKFGLTAGATGQYTRDILPSTEQVSFGAWRYALGYPQGDQGGDKGYGLSLELNRRFSLDNRYIRTLQPYIMLDHAQAWYNAPRLRPYNGRKLSSAGLGLRISDEQNYVFDINIARPTGARPITGKGRRLRVNTNFSILYGGH